MSSEPREIRLGGADVDLSAIRADLSRDPLDGLPTGQPMAEPVAADFGDDFGAIVPGAAPPAPPPPPPLTPEEVKQRFFLMKKLKSYANSSFKAHLAEEFGGDLSVPALQAKTTAELETMLQEVRLSVNSLSNTSFSRASFFGSLGVLEHVAVKKGARVEGLSRVLGTNQDVSRLVDEISLDTDLMYVSPWIKLGTLIAATAWSLHSLNKAAEEVAAAKAARDALTSAPAPTPAATPAPTPAPTSAPPPAPTAAPPPSKRGRRPREAPPQEPADGLAEAFADL